MSAPAHIPDIARQAAKAIAEAASSPSRVVLFGSHARGAGHADSDLDFLVIEDEVENAYLETVRLRRALRGLGVLVDIVVVSRAEEAEPRSLAVVTALREGIVLHERLA